MSILQVGKDSLDVIAFTVIALGLEFVGSYRGDIAQAIIEQLQLLDLEQSEELGEPLARFLTLGLGLLYLGNRDCKDATFKLLLLSNKFFVEHSEMTLLACAYAGRGNVQKVQEFFFKCAQHVEKGESYQGLAILGIAMVAMAEEMGLEMTIHSFEHLLMFGEQNIRRVVPLTLGLLYISNPKFNVMVTLSMLSHDADKEVAMVRIAQGPLHLGKGLLTLFPYHSERFLLCPRSTGWTGDSSACMSRYEVFHIRGVPIPFVLPCTGDDPRMLMTVDEDLMPLSVPVRVGQAIDVVSQRGCPKTITGFQTHTTPLLRTAGEKVEIATEKYISLSSVLEEFVILKQNPKYIDED